MIRNINDLFTQKPEEYLEEVIITPIGSSIGADTEIPLPAGLVLSDFESILIQGRYSPHPATITRGSITLIKEQLVVGNAAILSMSTSDIDVQATIHIQDDTTLKCTSAYNAYVTFIVGYRKRYATKNLSKTINVNGGLAVTVNSRYEIDIAAALGVDYLDRDLIVAVEVYNIANQGVEGWGNPEKGFFGGGASYGIAANTLNDQIIVQTAETALTHTSNSSGNPFAMSSFAVTSALCRVKVWKIDQYITVGVNDA